jgi:serine phosphatase RsbU (regulator of sigma subunit)
MATVMQTPVLAFEAHASRWNSPSGYARVGGDWCDIVSVSDDVLALTIGDVSGHGEPASETMELLRAVVVEAVRETRIPSQILAKANSLAYARADGLIATAIVAFLDRRRRTFTFANAGHPAPLLVTGTGPAFLTKSPGDLPLGIFPWHRSAAYVIPLPADALITLYTDGVIEHKRDLIHGELELARACRRVHERMESDAARSIAERVFRNGRGTDDAAVVAVRTAPDRTSSRWSRSAPPNVAAHYASG